MISCITKFDGSKLLSAAKKAEIDTLYKAAGLLMRRARDKIRFRKHKTSAAGAPPFQHTKGKHSFRHSIRFAVDEPALTAYVGPQKETMFYGKDVPRTLEFGGMGGTSPDPRWYQIHRMPKGGMRSKADVAAWLMLEGVGPLYMAGSESGLMNQVAASHGAKKYSRAKIAASRAANANHWMFRDLKKRSIPQEGKRAKKVFYYILPIRSMRQAQKAADNIVQYFGLPHFKPRYVKARPFMGPSMKESRNQLAQYLANTIR